MLALGKSGGLASSFVSRAKYLFPVTRHRFSSGHTASPREIRDALNSLSARESKGIINSLEPDIKSAIISELLSESLSSKNRQDIEAKIREIDTNHDGIISKDEFVTWWLLEKSYGYAPSGNTNAPTKYQLSLLALRNGLPFIGFGFLDNAIMIVAGEQIELHIGMAFGISTMAAAGLGNTISDVAGLSLGKYIEDGLKKLGIPDPHLSLEQLEMQSTKMVKVLSSVVCIVIGCLLGMLPLLFNEESKEARLTRIFRSVDADLNGTISLEEFLTSLSRLKIKGRADAQELFEQRDLDGDGQVSFSQFLALIQELDTKDEPSPKP